MRQICFWAPFSVPGPRKQLPRGGLGLEIWSPGLVLLGRPGASKSEPRGHESRNICFQREHLAKHVFPYTLIWSSCPGGGLAPMGVDSLMDWSAHCFLGLMQGCLNKGTVAGWAEGHWICYDFFIVFNKKIWFFWLWIWRFPGWDWKGGPKKFSRFARKKHPKKFRCVLSVRQVRTFPEGQKNSDFFPARAKKFPKKILAPEPKNFWLQNRSQNFLIFF